jgi:RNA polymerase sigma-70 factor, ECF subfamily
MKTVNLTEQSTETILIDKAVKGDMDAFDQLILTYQDMAYNYARALLGDPAGAEDAAQESFIKAFRYIKGFRGGSFRSWLLKIVTHSAYDMLRWSSRHPTQLLFPVDEDGEDIESPPWLVDPDVYRSVITLVDLYEIDYTEAADALKVPIGTVKSRLARARLRMKEKLGNGLNQPDGLQNAAANC